MAVLDEIDSGLDIDAVREVAELVEQMRGPDLGVVMITHYSRILRYLTPDRVHVMVDGRIVEFGGPELAEQLEQEGYEGVRRRLGIPAPVTTPEISPADLLTDTPFEVSTGSVAHSGGTQRRRLPSAVCQVSRFPRDPSGRGLPRSPRTGP